MKMQKWIRQFFSHSTVTFKAGMKMFFAKYYHECQGECPNVGVYILLNPMFCLPPPSVPVCNNALISAGRIHLHNLLSRVVKSCLPPRLMLNHQNWWSFGQRMCVCAQRQNVDHNCQRDVDAHLLCRSSSSWEVRGKSLIKSRKKTWPLNEFVSNGGRRMFSSPLFPHWMSQTSRYGSRFCQTSQPILMYIFCHITCQSSMQHWAPDCAVRI